MNYEVIRATARHENRIRARRLGQGWGGGVSPLVPYLVVQEWAREAW